MTAPRHESLEAVFFAAVPPRAVPWHRRALWWLLLLLLETPLTRKLLLKRFSA